MKDILEKLQAPFEKLSYRVQSYTKNYKAIILRYVDARDVQDRLDEVFGVDGWKTEYREVMGMLICRLYYRLPGTTEWQYKEDTGSESQAEKEKGHISDAFKRSAVQLGIARYLYREGTLVAHANLKIENDKIINKLSYVIHHETGKKVYDLDEYMRTIDPLYGGKEIKIWEEKIKDTTPPTPTPTPNILPRSNPFLSPFKWNEKSIKYVQEQLEIGTEIDSIITYIMRFYSIDSVDVLREEIKKFIK